MFPIDYGYPLGMPISHGIFFEAFIQPFFLYVYRNWLMTELI